MLATAVIAASPASAQTPLANVLPTLLGPGMRLAPGPGGTHADDFIYPAHSSVPFFLSARPDIFNEFVSEQLRTFPTATSSGGFLYSFDPAIGTFMRSTRSFGPLYAERALTSGRGTLFVGVNSQRLEFDRISGVPLDSNDVRMYFEHRDRIGGSFTTLTPELSDVIEATVRLKVRSNTLSTMMTCGLTDRLDIGIIVPFVETTLEAAVDRRILRLGTAANPTIHSFDGRGGDTNSDTGGGTRSGIGDIRLTGKYNVLRRPSMALAAAWDVRLPTGDADNLLGTGRVFTGASAIVSAGGRSLASHASITVTFVPSEGLELGFHEQGAELTYIGGFDWSVVPRATVNADVLIRSSFGDFGFQDDLRPDDLTLSYVTTASGPIQTLNVRQFGWTDSGPALMHAAIGGKVHVWRTVLAIGSVVLPLSDARLHNKPALSLGLEYTF